MSDQLMIERRELHDQASGTVTRPVLIVVDSMETGGMERQVLELLNGLASRRRFSVALAMLRPDGVRAPEAINFATWPLPVRRRARFDLPPAVALARQTLLLAAIQPDPLPPVGNAQLTGAITTFQGLQGDARGTYGRALALLYAGKIGDAAMTLEPRQVTARAEQLTRLGAGEGAEGVRSLNAVAASARR